VTTGTTSSWQKNESRQTTGMVDEDKAKVDAANEATAVAAEKANTEDYAAKATQYWTEFGRLSEQAKKQVAERAVLQEQEARFNESLNSAYKKLDETAARPVDPSQAFAGEKGWYAFMAGFGDVLRNVGAALAGKGPVADPGATLNALVERSVELQMAQKKADYEQGKISVDRLTADRETTRHKLGVVLQQLAATELGKAKTQEEYQALGALKAKGDAIVADARAKAAAATARQETTGTTISQGGSTTKGPATVGGGGGIEGFSKMLSAREAYEKAGANKEQLAAFDKANGLSGAGMAPTEESEAGRVRREKLEARTDTEKTALGTIQLLNETGDQLGLARDTNGRGFRENQSDKSILSKRTGEELATGFSFGFSDNPIAATENALVESFGRLQSQGVISPSEEVRFGAMVREAKTDSQRALALNSIRTIIEAKLNPRDREAFGAKSAEEAGFKRTGP
jgi:hypothetical protein